MHFMQIESVLQTKNRSEPAKNRFSVALVPAFYNFEYIELNLLEQHLLVMYKYCLKLSQ